LVKFTQSGADLIDRTTLRRNGEIVDYQYLFVNYRPFLGPGGENSYATGLSRVDCQHDKIEIVDATGYDDLGKEVYGVPILPSWETIVPGSESETMERTVCHSVSPKDILFQGGLHTVIVAVRAYLTNKR
jgi:hypothetical protein